MPLDPLVPARGDLPAGERRRVSRQLLLDGFGPQAQARLAGARVLVVGAGGLGSPALQYLAAAGVGTLGVVDDDVVETSNLQRQVLHGAGDVGRPKTTSAAESLRLLNPSVEVVEHVQHLDDATARGMLGGYDVVVDGSDTFATRYAVSDAAAALGLPVVWGSVLGWDGQVAVWWSAAPGGRSITYPDVFGPRPDAGPDGLLDGVAESCETVGVLGPACGVVGATMAVEAVKLLTGAGDVALGRLLVYDARTSAWDAVDLAPPAPGAVARGSVQTATAEPRDGTPTASRAAGEPAEGALVLDVGPVAGTLGDRFEGAVWVRLEDLAAGDYPPELLEHPAHAPVVVVCPTGLRSRGAARLLVDDGWRDVRPLAR
ncbi:HesA/MoeB/ThiF family protein [Isoptericola cucumis]|uniref:HesA/MoeB/ThiF family protein n=1 Tax=Isoptericola cucumis TaxID=1776856 RepID=UPI0032085C35